MTFPVFHNSQRMDPHPVSPEYVQGAIEGYLAAQPRYRRMHLWHLEALAKRLGDGAEAVIKDLLADGAVLRLDSSMMPSVFSLGTGTGFTTVRALQELAADWWLEDRLRDEVAAHLRAAGHPVTPTSGRTGDAVLGHRDGHLLGSPRKSR
ncbi:hypothetical protein RF644_17545 [Kocuria sp. CPCC 205258]|uniref:hypothetical protein n=1 Tax=Kocuria sp. CPCC 205258 TaxID=3073552 RepID=UPI0034D5A99A